MAGVKQFSEAEAIDRITTVFWERGYEATSIDDLVAATGVKRGSLYNAFGGKDAMYRRALEAYCDRHEAPLLAALNANDDVRVGLRAMLELQLADLGRDGRPSGCFVTFAGIDGSEAAQPVRKQARQTVRAMGMVLYDRLRRAQSRGEIAADADPRSLAWYFVTVSRSLPVMHRLIGDDAHLSAVIETALKVLDQPSLAGGASTPG